MFAPFFVAAVPEFTLVFGGSVGIVVLLTMFGMSMAALMYGVSRNAGRDSRSNQPIKNDTEARVKGNLSLCR